MKSLIFLIFPLMCSYSLNIKNGIKPGETLEIIKIDSVKDYYIFNSINKSGQQTIVIAAKKDISDCKPFKRFILLDSIKESSRIKMGSSYTLIGFSGFPINGVKVKNSGELVKSIDNCDSFTN